MLLHGILVKQMSDDKHKISNFSPLTLCFYHKKATRGQLCYQLTRFFRNKM